ncbi:hypothetical protein NB473_08750 [Vibrio parahaemolyticus]|nr:hypothetical protein [Vibrio parahaemolyticus]MCR9509351.1 hypothetical protein [Vibrio parahaemolyticus]MCS0120214.1 hypothetical protein [Vibrio parahaemolyticus]
MEIQSDEPQEKVTLIQGIISKTRSAYNARLSGEQRNTDATAYHLKH